MEIHGRLKTVYGDAVVDISNIQPRLKKFKKGENDISDTPRYGRPLAAVTYANLKRADELIRADRHIRVRTLLINWVFRMDQHKH